MSDPLSLLQAARRLHEATGVEGVLRALDQIAREELDFSRLWLGVVVPGEGSGEDVRPQVKFCDLRESAGDLGGQELAPLDAPCVRLLEEVAAGVKAGGTVGGEGLPPLPSGDGMLRCVVPLEMGTQQGWSLAQRAPSSRWRALAGIVVGDHGALPSARWGRTEALLGELVALAGYVLEREHIGRMHRQRVSQVSHELRTPLSSVLAFCEMLADGDAGKLNVKQDRFVRRISANGARLQRIVEDLLTISRLDAGMGPVEVQPVSVAGLMEDTVMNFWPQAGARAITLRVDAPADLPQVMTDPERFQQALSNLVDNAIKYSPSGSEVRVWAACRSGGDGEGVVWVQVGVTDQGEGIPPAEQGQVFGEFYRCRSVWRDQEAKGSGLGLAIVKRIMELLGGKVELASEVGKGSTFSLWLPASGGDAGRGTIR